MNTAKTAFYYSLLLIVLTAAAVTFLWTTNQYNSQVFLEKFKTTNSNEWSFTECEVALSLIIDQESTLQAALAPKSIAFEGDAPCQSLQSFINANPQATSNIMLRARYWWGFRSIYITLLDFFSFEQSRQLMTSISWLACLAFGIVTLTAGLRYFIVFCPLTFLLPYLSGLSFFPEPTLAFAWFWVIFTIAVTGLLNIHMVRSRLVYAFLFCSGFFANFIWFMGGELLLLSALIFTSFIFLRRKLDFETAAKSTALQLVTYCIGFSLSFIIGLLIKLLLIDYESVFDSTLQAVAFRSSDFARGSSIDAVNLFHQLVFVGFQHSSLNDNVQLWKFLLVSSSIIGLISFAYAIRQGINKRFFIVEAAAISILAAMFFIARLALVPNHSFTHHYLIGRYMALPICLIYSFGILVLTDAFQQFKRLSFKPG